MPIYFLIVFSLTFTGNLFGEENQLISNVCIEIKKAFAAASDEKNTLDSRDALYLKSLEDSNNICLRSDNDSDIISQLCLDEKVSNSAICLYSKHTENNNPVQISSSEKKITNINRSE